MANVTCPWDMGIYSMEWASNIAHCDLFNGYQLIKMRQISLRYNKFSWNKSFIIYWSKSVNNDVAYCNTSEIYIKNINAFVAASVCVTVTVCDLLLHKQFMSGDKNVDLAGVSFNVI